MNNNTIYIIANEDVINININKKDSKIFEPF